MGPFPSSNGNKYIIVAIDYVCKLVEAQAFPTSDAQNVLKSRWYGPFTVSKDMKGRAIKLCDEEGNEFNVNKQHVKPYQKDISDFDADDDITFDDEGVIYDKEKLGSSLDFHNPAVSSSVSADFNPVYADESTLPPGQSLGSSANTTRFPLSSDVCMDQLSSGIFTSSSYDDDFSATLTNLAPVVDVNPVPTRRVNTIHPQSQILFDLASPVLTRSRAQKSKFGESAFIDLVQDQTNDHHTINFIVIWLLPLLSKPTRLAKSLRILIGLLLCKQMQAIHQPGKPTDSDYDCSHGDMNIHYSGCQFSGRSAQDLYLLVSTNDSAGINLQLYALFLRSYGLCCWFRVHAGGHTSAGGFHFC
ncbi:putative ribonuclease H-like domain-containing protein [Tanacetum coccineum]